MRRLIAGGAIALAAILLSGCGTTNSFTALSSKNVNLSSIKLDQSKLKGHGVGESCQEVIVFVPLGETPNLKDAIDRTVESQKGDVLLNARVKFSAFYIPLIYGKTCWTAEGDVYDTY